MQIITERLVIRQFLETDMRDFLGYQSHPVVREFMPGSPMDDPKAEAFISRQAAMSGDEKDAYHAFAVTLEKRVIGDIGIFLPSGDLKTGDLGFQFNPEFHGHGYAFEAGSAFVRYAFDHWNLDLITSACDSRNVRSYRLMLKLGMQPVESGEELSYQLTRANV